ncbi:MAG: hypothetical protein C0467_19560 [Planctomycetaceae bacterium]|nr:hypothetical protein [Planctomycetaceae bacterium]
MSKLRWLRPWHPVSGLLFGYLFGVVWCFTLFCLLDGWNISLRHASGGFLFAGFWAVFWGLSGLACHALPGYDGTTASVLSIICGHVYPLACGALDGWVFVTIPFYTTMAALPCHWALVLIASIRGRVE